MDIMASKARRRRIPRIPTGHPQSTLLTVLIIRKQAKDEINKSKNRNNTIERLFLLETLSIQSSTFIVKSNSSIPNGGKGGGGFVLVTVRLETPKGSV